jgi:hypothetical protein
MSRLVAEICAAALALIAAFVFGYRAGHVHGVDGQKVADQAIFDKTKAALEQQKTEAANTLQAAYAKNAADAASQASRLHDLEERHEQDSQATASANARASARVLRITVPTDPGCRPRGAGASASQGAASGADATTTVELPAETARRVLAVGFDANTLADNYRACYAFVHPEGSP